MNNYLRFKHLFCAILLACVSFAGYAEQNAKRNPSCCEEATVRCNTLGEMVEYSVVHPDEIIQDKLYRLPNVSEGPGYESLNHETLSQMDSLLITKLADVDLTAKGEYVPVLCLIHASTRTGKVITTLFLIRRDISESIKNETIRQMDTIVRGTQLVPDTSLKAEYITLLRPISADILKRP